MKTKLYLHSNKDSNYEKGEELGLTGEALKQFAYALSEVEFEVGIDPETGVATILSVDGKALVSGERKLFIQDEDSHWYLIPTDLYKRFIELEKGDCEQFCDEFDKYRSFAPHCYGVIDPKEGL